MPPRRAVLILGFDGASFDVIRPLVAAGGLPNLARWMGQGTVTDLASTVPPMSFPAWSSFLTGLGPGRHGIFDFTQKQPGAYRIHLVNATHRHGASFFQRISRAGGRVLALGVPATFPPERVDGLLVAGFDAPISTGTEPRSASDPNLYAEIADRAGPWMRPDLNEGRHDAGWHERAVVRLLERIDRKTRFAIEALRRLRAGGGRRVDLMTVVFSESDTVAHHFWRDHDAHSPRHDPRASALRKGAIAAVYERLDAAAGEIRRAFGEEAVCLVVSDHGMGGASRRVVHLNRRLADAGLLARRAGVVGAGVGSLARGARDLALRALPPAAAQALFRRLRAPAARIESLARFGGIDWRATAAFSEEANTNPGVWINLRGREAEGRVAPEDYARVRSEVIEALLDWKLPGGGPVVAWARTREQVYRGPYAQRAPDVVLELAGEDGYTHSLVATPWHASNVGALRTLQDEELSGGRGRGLNGTHRPEGILIAVGGEEPLRPADVPASIVDVAPTVLRATGVAWKDQLDGVPLESDPVPYTAEEEARVTERLRALGYLQ